MDRNMHEVPLGLSSRPTVAIRQIPGKVFRVPARAATIFGVGVLIWGVLYMTTPLPWFGLAIGILFPVLGLCALVEMKPGGKQPLAWFYIMLRHRTRPALLLSRRLRVEASSIAPTSSTARRSGR